MADFNLRALKVTQGENFTVCEDGRVAGQEPMVLADPDAGGNYNIKVRIVTNPIDANLDAVFMDDQYIDLIDTAIYQADLGCAPFSLQLCSKLIGHPPCS